MKEAAPGIGDHVWVKFVAEKPTSQPSPMKVFEVRVTRRGPAPDVERPGVARWSPPRPSTGWPTSTPTSSGGGCCRSEPGTKLPASADWPRKATRDPTTIDEWWGNGKGYGIGIATGQESGIVVVDVDNGPGKFGEDSLDAFVDRVGPLPDSPTALTPNGRHLYFKWPGFNPAQDLLGPGIDLQAEGRYVVAPPSVHPSGKEYCWEHSLRPSVVPVPELPGLSSTTDRVGGRWLTSIPDSAKCCGPPGSPGLGSTATGTSIGPDRARSPWEGTSVTVYPFPDSHCVCYSTSVPGLKVRQPYQPSELARALGVVEPRRRLSRQLRAD